MTVLEVVNKYDLADVDKNYKDIHGQRHNLVNLKKLAKLEVKDLYINLKTNEAIITVIGIEEV